MNQDELREIPSVDKILKGASFPDEFPRPLQKRVVNSTLNKIRKEIKAGGECPDNETILENIKLAAVQMDNNRVRPVLNATGVVLHTNLGRAPYSEEALDAMTAVAGGYSSLEIDVSTGDRGGRGFYGEELLRQLTGAEAAGIVNNCSGALVLALKAIAAGKDVLISRSELVQIGGGFRIPDVLEASGSKLREVGTTNKTNLDDYRSEIDEEIGMLLRVHRSNFDLVGFTDSPSHGDLAELAHEHDLPYVCDLGSGALWDTTKAGMKEELRPENVLDSGADLISFSGDKLLGGPQAGIFLGLDSYVSRMKNHPFFRALRCGKATLAALEATLEAYAKDCEKTLPAIKRFSESSGELKNRVMEVYEKLGEPQVVQITEMEATVGGGSLPRETLDSWGLEIDSESPEKFLQSLRQHEPPVIGRLKNGRILLNFRTILPGQEDELCDVLKKVLETEVTV